MKHKSFSREKLISFISIPQIQVKFLFVCILLLFPVAAQTQNAQPDTVEQKKMKEDEPAVKEVIEQFLKAAGNYDVAALRPLFLPNANIGGHRFKNGQWIPFSITAEVWLESLSKNVNPRLYTEPVSNYTIHISEGRLAFVKADAVLHRDGVPTAHNMDFFVLMKENNVWKILSGSYTSVPVK
jgi:hypothetical protein